MKRTRKVGTIVICVAILMGFLLVLLTVFFYGLNNLGVSNDVVSFFNQNADVDFRWKKDLRGKYDKFDKKKNILERYEAVSTGIADTIEAFCTSAIPGNKYAKFLVDGYKEGVLVNTISGTVGGKTNDEYAKEAVYNLEAFADYLRERGTDFIYVQMPNGTRMEACASDDGEYPAYELDLGDKFSAYLGETIIPFINISEYRDNVAKYSMDVTNHWMPGNGLDATGILAKEMKDYGYDIDASLFDKDRYYNALDTMPKIAEDISTECGYEFYLPIPLESVEYRVDFFGTEIREGDFLNTLLADSDKWNEKSDTGHIIAYHNMYLINNGTYTDIINQSNPNKYRVVIFGDSFSWPITSYLSEGLYEVTYMNPQHFDGNAREFVEYYNPDLVMCIFLEPKDSVSFDWIY